MDLVERAPRDIAYPPVIQDLARAIEEGYYHCTPEDQVCEQGKGIVQHHVSGGSLTTAEAEEWQEIASQTVRVISLTRDSRVRAQDEARLRLDYEKARKDVHGTDSEPALTTEGERIVREQREDHYWDICQRLASGPVQLRASRIYEMYWLAGSLEKTDPSRAMDVYSKYIAGVKAYRLEGYEGYVLSALERMSLLHERARQFTEALEVIAQYEETVRKESRQGSSAPKHELATMEKRKARILAKLARRSGGTA
jgi:hypothetical protein